MAEEFPKCPKCPTGYDGQIIISKSRPDCWYCCNCGNYFKDINGKKPNKKSLIELLKLEETPELRWSSEEVTNAKDFPVASFYAMLNDGDRFMLLGAHIDIHHDYRDEFELRAESINPEEQADGSV